MYSVNGVLEGNKTIAAGYNYMYKRRLNNSLQSSLKSHSLWVTL